MDPGKFQEKVRSLLRGISRDEVRAKVSDWHKLIASASSRFSRGQTPMDEEANSAALLSPAEERPRNKSPVQLWVDSLLIDDERKEEDMPPITQSDQNDPEVESFSLGAEAPGIICPMPYPCVQVSSACGGSDAGSHCSSMESLLESRRPDPEEILIELGFGGSENTDTISRIPERFLRPSQMKGIVIDDFIRHQQKLVHTYQSGFSGYRGLTGPSHAIPSGIVGKIMDRLREAEVERQNQRAFQQLHQQRLIQQHCPSAQQPHTYSPKLARLAQNLMVKMKRGVKEVSVLSPENRNWYESQGDKSPEPAGRRIIIGHHSYTFAKDGNLVEEPKSPQNDASSSESTTRTASDDTDFWSDKFYPKSLAGFDEESADYDEPSISLTALDANSELNSSWAVGGSSSGRGSRLSSPMSTVDQSQLELEYRSMVALLSQLSASELQAGIGTEDQFMSLEPEERKRLQIAIIEAALSTYQKRLKELDLRSHLRDLLSGQLHKVTDLLDSTTSPSVHTILKQLTSLLRHQESLRVELSLHDPPSQVNCSKGFS